MRFVRRVHEHREGLVGGFTKRYKLRMLVYFEAIRFAAGVLSNARKISNIGRELWKPKLVESMNPLWRRFVQRYRTLKLTLSLPGLTRQSMMPRANGGLT